MLLHFGAIAFGGLRTFGVLADGVGQFVAHDALLVRARRKEKGRTSSVTRTAWSIRSGRSTCGYHPQAVGVHFIGQAYRGSTLDQSQTGAGTTIVTHVEPRRWFSRCIDGLHSASDLDGMLLDHMSFRRAVKLGLSDSTPAETTFRGCSDVVSREYPDSPWLSMAGQAALSPLRAFGAR